MLSCSHYSREDTLGRLLRVNNAACSHMASKGSKEPMLLFCE